MRAFRGCQCIFYLLSSIIDRVVLTDGVEDRDGDRMNRASKLVYFGDEGQRRIQGREAELFPLPARPRFRAALWVSLLLLGAVLAYLITALAGHVK